MSTAFKWLSILSAATAYCYAVLGKPSVALTLLAVGCIYGWHVAKKRL